MKLGFNFKNGEKYILNDKDTDKVIKKLNYFKLIKYLLNSKEITNNTIDVLGKKINTNELYSIEFLL